MYLPSQHDFASLRFNLQRWQVLGAPDALRLVMLGDEALEQADAEGGRALGHGGSVLLRPGGAGDVEMGPWRLVEEALQELGGSDAAGVAAATDILDVRRVAVELAVIRNAE